MDPRLEKVCLSGDVAALRCLLQEDRLILHRVAASPSVADGPLHVAALLGHVELVRELLRLSPVLVREVNPQGFSPLHLAAAAGHAGVVKEILLIGGSHLCLVQDKDGQLPLHAAAGAGRVAVMEELLDGSPDTARELTGGGDTILHLAVKSNSFEATRYVVGKFGVDEEFFNAGDAKGNTALHLGTARRQTQTVKLLLSNPGINPTAANSRGSTALDVLLEMPGVHGDLALGEMILGAGGKTTGEGGGGGGAHPPPPFDKAGNRAPPAERWVPRWSRPQQRRRNPDGWSSYTPTTLMVVAVLIATVTFQAGLQPPKRLNSDEDGRDNSTSLGRNSTTGNEGFLVFDNIPAFLFLNMTALFASICVILLLICTVPPARRKLMSVLVWVVWVAVYSTALAFTFGALETYRDIRTLKRYLLLWLVVLGVTVVWTIIRFVLYLSRKLLHREKGRRCRMSPEEFFDGEEQTVGQGVLGMY